MIIMMILMAEQKRKEIALHECKVRKYNTAETEEA
jgi:hypothetical protein